MDFRPRLIKHALFLASRFPTLFTDSWCHGSHHLDQRSHCMLIHGRSRLNVLGRTDMVREFDKVGNSSVERIRGCQDVSDLLDGLVRDAVHVSFSSGHGVQGRKRGRCRWETGGEFGDLGEPSLHADNTSVFPFEDFRRWCFVEDVETGRIDTAFFNNALFKEY